MKYCTICNAKYDDTISFCAVDGEVLEDDPTTIVGSTLDGQYHIEAMLGKGGMGAVYRARHILLGDRVAIKVLPPQMRNNAEWLRRFRREGQAARRFRHPNAVTVYDLRTTSEGMIYMVMEYVEGRTLDAELKARGRFIPPEALNVLEPVMSVLNAAHAQGVVHRDLKPENIMIGKPADGQSVVKLLDLGIAKISEMAGADAGGSTALTVAGQILGTPFYMSPEQWGEAARDANPEIDGRADIYSLGVVIYELVAGRRPFVGLTLQELRREHVSVAPRPLKEVVSDVPEEFSQAVARAMSKDRSDRQATAGDLANELRAALGLTPMSMSAPSLAASSSNLSDSPAQTSLVAASATNKTGVDDSAAMGGDGGSGTQSDISAPTVLTLDSPPRPNANQPPLAATSLAQMPPGQSPAPPTPPTPPPANAPPMPTMATNPNAVQHTSGFTAPVPPPPGMPSGAPPASASYTPQPSQQYVLSSPAAAPSYAPAAAAGVASKGRSPVIPIVIGVLLLFVLLGVGGGLFIWSRMGSSTEAGETKPKDGDSKPTTDDGKKETTTAKVEAMRYWLEIDKANGNQSARVAGVVPLKSGQSFRFYFKPEANGYLYIVGPGANNVPTTFLTDKPFPGSGVTTNNVNAGASYGFPTGDGNWIKLDNTEGTELYTVIFSKSQITSLPFFNKTAFEALSEAEQTQLNDYLKQYKANAPITDVFDQSNDEPYVSVKSTPGENDPLVFNVRIEHK